MIKYLLVLFLSQLAFADIASFSANGSLVYGSPGGAYIDDFIPLSFNISLPGNAVISGGVLDLVQSTNVVFSGHNACAPLPAPMTQFQEYIGCSFDEDAGYEDLVSIDAN